jgi:hypothetical protein
VQSYVRPQRAALATVVPDGSSQAGTQSIIRAVSAGRFPGFPVGGLTAMPSSSHCARNWSVSVPFLLRNMPLSRCEQSCWQAPRLRPTGPLSIQPRRARDLFYAHQHQAHLGHKDHQNNYEDHEKDCAPHSVQSRPYSRFMEYPRQPRKKLPGDATSDLRHPGILDACSLLVPPVAGPQGPAPSALSHYTSVVSPTRANASD